MLVRRLSLAFLIALLALLVAADPRSIQFSFSAAPYLSIPIGADTEFFTLGAGGDLRAGYTLPFLPIASAIGSLGYTYVPLRHTTSLSIVAAALGISFDLLPFRFMTLSAFGQGGYYLGFLNDGSATPGGRPLAAAGAGMSFRILPFMRIGIDGAYRYYFGLYNDVAVSLSASLDLNPRQSSSAGPSERPSDLQGRKVTKNTGAELSEIAFENIFPVFYKYYDEHPAGKAQLRNWEKVSIQDISIGVWVKEYMTNAKETKIPGVLEPQQQMQVDLFALFASKVLEISEGTKVSANITLSYTQGGKRYTREYVEAMRIMDRNAMTWDDDRKAAAFVAARDPTVQKLAKNVTSIVKGNSGRALNPNFLMAVGLHETLGLYGLSYSADPSSSYETKSKDKAAVDFLQFPQQTLEFKAGDCDDLSILYCALLESVGIQTAFITVPGHIYMAFDLGVDTDVAKRSFQRIDDLVFEAGKTWVPVEVTVRQGGFLKAWDEGAKEWRESKARSQAAFFPVQDCWALYEPVGFSTSAAQLPLPSDESIALAFSAEVTRFVDRETAPAVASLQAEIQKSGGKAKAINVLGVLYARYGLTERAEKQFRLALDIEEYVPALLNLGNIYFLKQDMQKAYEFYDRAYKNDPQDSKVLLGYARVNHQIENYALSRAAYEQLKRRDSGLAQQFAYLELRGQEATRAAEVGQVEGVVVWDE